jgi:glycosyltransferase involved in cell wall biosynthesis
VAGDDAAHDRDERPAAGAAEQTAAPVRIAVVGLSSDDPCGVRDHAARLADALAGDRLTCSIHWLSRSPGSLRIERAQVRGWAHSLRDELVRARADAVLLHYSVFAFSHRGVPLFARPVLSAVRSSRLPLVTFMHEYAYPWHLGGARGKVWAATQRIALRDVVASSDRLIVSADERAAWLRSRAWLAERPVSVAPVFSNLPRAGELVRPSEVPTLGLFGYGHEGVDVATVLDALRELRDRAGDVRLMLLGAPGSPSAAAARWQRKAAARGLASAIDFSGRLAAEELTAALAGCDVLLFAERGGPTSRKTTLAASLASGRPVVALDGPATWPQLARTRAVVIVAPWARALADAVAPLLEDRAARERQGRAGREFAARAMSVERSVEIVCDALRAAISRSRG